MTKALVNHYIQNENMVILVVLPANSDFQNAAAIKLAKAVDPDGRRTLGVVSKVRELTVSGPPRRVDGGSARNPKSVRINPCPG